jgi:radical SAM protein
MNNKKWSVDFSQAPLLVIWEVTRSCALACRHCRASAENRRDPLELSTDEGKRLIDDVVEMGTPLIVFTGGDPIQRTDLEELIAHAKSRNLKVGTIPAATPLLTRERLESLKAAGIDQLAISIDGPTAAEHDDFRRIPGAFDIAIQGARWVREIGVPLQINTVFGQWNVNRFEEIATLVSELGAAFWEVFFLVPTGRGSEIQGCTPDEFEQIFAKLHAMSMNAPFIIKVTEGQHFRRYVAQQAKLGNQAPTADHRRSIGVSVRPVNSGNGFCFVDHQGNVCPSGFLPLFRGNLREKSIIDVYRNDPVFRDLRDLSLLKGKCRVCDYKEVCSGGSRARAFALTGDMFAEDPYCAYEPAGAPVA